jgi:predicted RNase H-like HicB family nuclease
MVRYPILIEPGDANHAFGVVVPDLSGCFSGGDTLEEALVNARYAIADWIEVMLEIGGDVPSPSAERDIERRDGWLVTSVTVAANTNIAA